MPEGARSYAPDALIPGTVYQVVRLIGAGGMGTVYDVEDTTIGKRYVLKTLHPQLGAREDLARRMQNEARTLARLNHTNIVEVITAGVTADELRLPYYVMERLNGQSLRVVLEKKGQLELPHALHIAIDLLDALDHAHEKGVIHRDVKPDNIFLHRTSAGVTVTKLLDFGIVSLLDASTRETAGRFLGTLRYAAPEQLRGEKPTPKMDVYAAGLVVYEAIAGRGPFDDEGDGHRVASAHVNKPPPLLSRFVAVPRELDLLLAAALAKDPAGRPRDAFSFAASLRNIKRALVGALAQDSTENRATAAAVLGADSVASPYVEQPVISPAGAPTPRMTALPKTTVHGMTPPTLGPSLAQPIAYAPTATTPDAVDRMAPTSTIAADTRVAPQHHTEAFPLVTPAQVALGSPAPTVPQAPIAGSFQWPPERAVVRSESPQVRTVSAAPAGPWPSAAPLVAALLALVGVVASVALVVVLRRSGPSGAATPTAPAQTLSPPAFAPPPPQPVLTVPAPTLEPPAFEEPSVARPSFPPRPINPVPTPVRSKTPPPPSSGPAAAAPPKPVAPPPPAALDRPGPGF